MYIYKLIYIYIYTYVYIYIYIYIYIYTNLPVNPIVRLPILGVKITRARKHF